MKANVLVLTATVFPNVEGWLVVSDPKVRLAQYQASIAWWSTALERTSFELLVVETSGAPQADLLAGLSASQATATHFFHFHPEADQIARGKGAIEMHAIESALDTCDWLTGHSTVYKCTGRLPLENAKRLLAAVAPDTVRLRMTLDRSWADTRFFGAQLDVWRRLFFPAADQIDDSLSKDSERVVAARMAGALALREVRLDRFPERPIFSGVSGTSGRSYGPRTSRLRASILQPVETWLLSVASRKQV